MSESDANPAADLPDPGERPEDVESITDPNQYALRRRLGQILDARERVIEARQEAREKFREISNNSVRASWSHGHVAQAVHEYAIEVEPLLNAADDSLDTEWPEKSLWTDLDAYIDTMGYVPSDCPAVAGGPTTDSRNSDDKKLHPPTSRYSLMIYRYLNESLADLGLDINRVDDTPFNRY